MSEGRVLITGATGFIGQHLVRTCVEKGIPVTIWVRNTAKAERLFSGLDIQILGGALNDLKDVIPLLSEVKHIFHLAGCVNAARKKQYYETNTASTEQLIKAAHREGKGRIRFYLVSSLEAGGPYAEGVRSESTPDQPITHYGKSKYLAEKWVAQFKDDLFTAIIRPPVVYGPGDPSMLTIFKCVQQGWSLQIGPSEQYVSMIYIQDLIDALMAMMDADYQTGQTYYYSDRVEGWSWREIQNEINHGSKPLHVCRIPIGLLKSVCMIGQAVQWLLNGGGWLNMTRYISLIQPRWVCDHSRIMTDLDIAPKISLQEGLARTLKWYRQNNWI